MSGRTPAEAVNAFLEPIQQVVSCVTGSVVSVQGGYFPAGKPHLLTFADGYPARLSGDARLLLWLNYWYRILPNETGWYIHVVGYFHSLADQEDIELLTYQWHPDSLHTVDFPHVHIGPAGRVGYADLLRAHLPTGFIAVREIVRLVIIDFGINPRRDDWQEILGAPPTA